MAKRQVHGGGADAGGPTGKFVTDFIGGRQVRATPDEVDAVQVFARRLVEDCGYECSPRRPANGRYAG